MKKAERVELQISAEKLVSEVKRLIEEGKARKIIIKNENGDRIVEVPLFVGATVAVLAPVLAALGAAAALLTKCTIVVVKRK